MSQLASDRPCTYYDHLLRLYSHVPNVLTRIERDLLQAECVRDAGSPTRADAGLEELDFFAVDGDGVAVDEAGLSQHDVQTVLLAEVLSRVMYCYLGADLAHALHDFGEVDFNFTLDFETELLGS